MFNLRKKYLDIIDTPSKRGSAEGKINNVMNNYTDPAYEPGQANSIDSLEHGTIIRYFKVGSTKPTMAYVVNTDKMVKKPNCLTLRPYRRYGKIWNINYRNIQSLDVLDSNENVLYKVTIPKKNSRERKTRSSTVSNNRSSTIDENDLAEIRDGQ